MYADMSWTVKGLREALTRRGVPWDDAMRKPRLVRLYNDSEFEREQAVFRSHMAGIKPIEVKAEVVSDDAVDAAIRERLATLEKIASLELRLRQLQEAS